jgi:hypothetical protein
VFALRFRAYGRRHYLTLGTAADGWSRQKAEAELRHVLADVERGIWIPPAPGIAQARVTPTFHEFASDWLDARSRDLRETTLADYSWPLTSHLLPFFHAHRLPQITVAEVDRYREHKVREGLLSAESINKTITRLGQILAVAEERELIARNPVRVNTRNRKLKAPRQRPVWLDSAEQIQALLDAATRLDASATARTAGRRGFIAVLVFTLRVCAHAMRRDSGDKDRLKALVEGRDWAPMGTGNAAKANLGPSTDEPLNDGTPADAEVSTDGRGWFRTSDLSRVKQSAMAAGFPGFAGETLCWSRSNGEAICPECAADVRG